MFLIIKTILRRIRNEKAISFLSLAGLSLAFCVAIPLICNIEFNRSFDRFYPDYKRIYNVYVNETYHGTNDVYGELPLAFGENIEGLFPEVEEMVRTKDQSGVLVSVDNTQGWKEDVLWADPSVKDLFYINLLTGDKSSFLLNPNEILISESLSGKIFGDSNSVGRNIKIAGKNYMISGIFKDYPQNSHLKFTVLIPLLSRIPNEKNYNWDSYEFLTYIKIKNRTDIKKFGDKLQEFITDYWIPWLKSTHGLDYVFNDENAIKLKLMPVADIHLKGSAISSFEKESNASIININLVIVLVLMLIAYFNLIGFTFSKRKRHKHQIKIKRSLGASGIKIISDFVFENIFYTAASFIAALLIIYELWSNNPPVLADLNSVPLSDFVLPVSLLLLFAIFIAVFLGIVTGIYFNRITHKMNSDDSTSYSRLWFNRVMIVSQLASSIILIICLTGIFKQLNYLSDYDTGLNTSNVVIIENGNKIGNNYTTFQEELIKSSLIKGISCSNSYPFNAMSSNSFTHANSSDKTPYPFQYFRVDTGFQNVFDFKLTEGRWFSGYYSGDKNAIIFNKAAVKVMGMKNPVNEEFYETIDPDQRYHVIGVSDNFNFRSLHHKVEPLLLCFLNEGDYWRDIEIKGTTSDRNKLIAEIKLVWDKISGNEYMDYSFLEDKISVLYMNEKKLEMTIGIFCLVAILISCFGLLGTILNTTSEKTKEIAIRKINGAGVTEVIRLLLIDFINWLAIAFIISCPVSWYILIRWLQNFAYRTELKWWIFVLSGILAFGIVLITVSWQSWRAATKNPVEALRYE
jgi:putative ABC transport system permease protein